MADTNQHSAHAGGIPVEGDGIHYSGIGWFVVILTATTLFCMAIVWGLFVWLDARTTDRDPARAVMASPAVEPAVVDGRIQGAADRPGPALLLTEPTVLDAFRSGEEATLSSYGWVDRNAGIVRIPIERAKELLLERGLPSR